MRELLKISQAIAAGGALRRRLTGVSVPPMDSTAGFTVLGEALPASPVVVSVPHAGRDYPLVLRAALRGPLGGLQALEDRHVDAVASAARRRETLIVQHRARAWIDLNRAEDERDPMVDEGADPATVASAKVANGLGLIPRRAGGGTDLWRRRWSDAEVRARIASDHRLYHEAVAAALAAARRRWGTAVLLDLHSMPPLSGAGRGVRVVLGDRWGRASSPRFMARVEAVATAARCPVQLNTPYAGGHILDRHGSPGEHIHAVQVELDRSLYLDHALDRPGSGLQRTAEMVRQMLAALADEALAHRDLDGAHAAPIAAE